MRNLLLAISLTMALGSACAPQGSEDLCAQAADHLQSCGAMPEGFKATCTDRDAQALLSLSCSELETGGSGGDKEDGILGWKDKGVDCWYDWQCEGVLICRPGGAEDDVCLAPGSHGALCGETQDCAEPLECVEDSTHGDRCRQPLN